MYTYLNIIEYPDARHRVNFEKWHGAAEGPFPAAHKNKFRSMIMHRFAASRLFILIMLASNTYAKCPSVQPRDGDSCTDFATSCDYGVVCCPGDAGQEEVCVADTYCYCEDSVTVCHKLEYNSFAHQSARLSLLTRSIPAILTIFSFVSMAMLSCAAVPRAELDSGKKNPATALKVTSIALPTCVHQLL